MTDDARVLTLLAELLDELPDAAPDRLLANVLDEVQRAPQRRRWWSARRRDVPGSRRTLRPLVTGVVIASLGLTIAILVSQLAPPQGVAGPVATASPTPSSLSPSPIPSASPSPRATLSTSPGPVTILEKMGSEGLLANVTYTSDRFAPAVTFSLPLSTYAEPTTDWCSPRYSDSPRPYTSPRTIVLAYRAGCVSDLRVIRPWAVACGRAGDHPTASSLAAALLSIAGATDRGTPQTAGAVPPNLIHGSYTGRVISIDGHVRAFQGSVVDPDHCRLIPEPGSGDPTIEVRADMAALLVLLDVNGELIVIRAADGGYDAPTGLEAHGRGYGVSSNGLLEQMLGQIHDIEFK